MTYTVATEARNTSAPQAWLSSPAWDTAFIIGPAFLSSAVALIFKQQMENSPHLPLWAWVSLVLCIDVAHVYATLFRTYFDRQAFERNSTLLTTVPIACWAVGVLLYSINAIFFWRTLAYLAVFHFIRQQYGFVMLYARREPAGYQQFRWLDHIAIYTAMLFPLLFWHTHLPRNFEWFVEGDFIASMPAGIADVGFAIYLTVGVAYLAKECVIGRSTGYFNIPKNLIITGTALSWWVGIVAINSDMAFTLTNVVTHGIPYVALVWLYHRIKPTVDSKADFSAKPAGSTKLARDAKLSGNIGTGSKTKLADPVKSVAMPNSVKVSVGTSFEALFAKLTLTNIVGFALVLLALAYLEEGLWDGLVWREHLSVFQPFAFLPSFADKSILAVLIPLLSLPQSAHYVLDGFIWRVKDRSNIWSA